MTFETATTDVQLNTIDPLGARNNIGIAITIEICNRNRLHDLSGDSAIRCDWKV